MKLEIHGRTSNLANALSTELNRVCGKIPTIALTLGSGLANAVLNSEHFAIQGALDTSGFGFKNNLPVFGAEGHKMNILVVQEKATRKFIVVVCGRKHLYEIHNENDASEVLRMPRALVIAGVRSFINTSAVGGIDIPTPGRIVIFSDHDGAELLPPSLFTGTRSKKYGPLFFDCTNLYKKINPTDYLTARELLIARGVAQWHLGPNFETPAQVRRLKLNGISVVGMSGLPETMALNQMKFHESGEFKNIQVIGLGVVSNPGAGLGTENIDSNDVNTVTSNHAPELMRFISEIIQKEDL